MKPARVCMVVQNYYQIDPRVRRKADALVKRGHMVDVIALREPQQAQVYELSGVTVYTVPLQKMRSGRLRYLYEYGVFWVLAFFLLTFLFITRRYDVIDVNTLPDFLVFAALVPKLMGSRVMLDMHEVMPEFYMSKFGVPADHWIVRLVKWQERLSFQFADQVITINDSIKDVLEKRGLPPDKVMVIMNSADGALFAGRWPAQSDHSNKHFTLMYHGTLTSIYGLDIALHAFALAGRQMPDAEFWIVGDGPEYAGLQSLARELDLSDNVKFIGSVPQQDIPIWLTQCSVGVLATRQDPFLDLSFSNKLPEYIVMGKPVIVSRLETIRRYFSEEALAFFDPHNETDLARRMVELYENSDRRRELAERAAQEYAPIDWSVMKHRYLDLFETL